MKLQVKKIHTDAILPTKAYHTDLGIDFYCVADETFQEPCDKEVEEWLDNNNNTPKLYEAINKASGRSTTLSPFDIAKSLIPKYIEIGPDRMRNGLMQHTFSTGVQLELPNGYGMIIMDRSSMGVNHSLKVMGGIIDNTYRGEIKICLCSMGKHPGHRIIAGDKIAQGILIPLTNPLIVEISELSKTERGDQSFGSSGR